MKRNPAIWTLVAGAVIGAGTVVSLNSGNAVQSAFANPPAQMRATAYSGAGSEGLTELKKLDASLSNLADYAAKATVHIRAEGKRERDMFGNLVESGGQGSGVIFRADGYIITNDHVAGGYDKVMVDLEDGREFPGKVLRAKDSDIAVVKIDAKDLPSLSFADSSAIKPGQMAMAIGSPFGLEDSVTFGHVSALHRKTQIEGRTYLDLMQTDAAINMGNSGGPLIDVDGEVIGINTSIATRNGGSNGVGFAIPSNQARLIAEQLISSNGNLHRAGIGVIPETIKPYRLKELNIEGGVRISELLPDGPAVKAGMKEGDVVIRIGDYQVRGESDLREALLRETPDSKVKVEIIRGSQHQVLDVTLGDAKILQDKFVPKNAPQTTDPQSKDPLDGIVPDDSNPAPKGFGNLNPFKQSVPKSTDGKPHLGVKVADVTNDLHKAFSIPSAIKGAVVIEVTPGSVAEALDMQVGDLVVAFDGNPISASKDVSDAIAKVKLGEQHRIKFVRYSKSGTSSIETSVTFH